MSNRWSSSRVKPLIVLAALMLAGCTAHKQPWSVETALANAAKDVVIPLQAEKLVNPLTVSPEVVSAGQQIYTQSCAVCHGPDGRGSDLGRDMYPPAMDLNSPHVQHWKDADLFWIVQNGVRLTGMPSWKSVLSDDETWKVVTFLRDVPKANGQSRPAQVQSATAAQTPTQLVAYGLTLYRQEGCFTCHKLDGEGNAVGPNLTFEGTRGRSDGWLIGHFKNPPEYTPGSVMPAFANLTDEQLQALTAFLQSQKGQNPDQGRRQ
jgi:mono/diheme cytochrome c family protein